MNNEHLLHSTVRITSYLPNNIISTRTGFFFLFEIDNNIVSTIVTNKHVIRNSIKGKIRLSLADDNDVWQKDKYIDIDCDNFENMWLMHPESTVDLCVMPVASLLYEAQKRNKRIYFKALDKSIIPTAKQLENITAIEDILMIGYPSGLWDSYNNMPIVRKGVTATNIKLDYNGKEEFLIDIASYPGSSGSPIFIYNQGSFPTNNGLNIGDRLLFVGILYAGTQISINGNIEIVEVPTVSSPTIRSTIPNNIGIIIKSEKILDFEKILKEKFNSNKKAGD
jgi:V8-like Glu-specific endopeptidase